MLPFSAPTCSDAAFSGALDHLAVQKLPYAPVGPRLSSWCEQPYATALISDGSTVTGRYSYLMAGPDALAVLAYDDPRRTEDLLNAATVFVSKPTAGDLPPFTGGLIGLASFELGLRLENMRRRPFRIEGRKAWPELVLLRYPAVLAFDHVARTLTAIGRGDSAEAAQAACDALAALYEQTPERGTVTMALSDGPLHSETPDALHEDKVAALVQQIHAGDLFQANLARGWRGRLRDGATPGQLIQALHGKGAAPFGAAINLGTRAVVSNSPERFIRLDSTGHLETRPIKGTRPRGQTPDLDRALADELMASEKDRAENLMIVDLMRHDLSKVADIGSVRVTKLNALESYPNVHHLVSTVTGRLRADKTAADVLCATLSPGSISGAPKVQAMKVISEMEAARGPYCGALFFIDIGGAMESSVLIRTLALERDETDRWQYRVCAGGGIVADSEPAAERRETETKLSLIRAVLEG